MKINVLVTGATGFAGSHIINELIARGYRVRGMIEPGDKAEHLKKTDCELVEADLLNPESLPGVFGDCSCVIHAAGNVSMRVLTRKKMKAVNIQGTENLVKAAKRAGIKRFVHISSVGVLGGLDKPGIIDEDHPAPRADHQGHHYHQTKIDSEQIVLKEKSDDFEVVVVLPGLLYGANDWRMSSTGYVLYGMQGGILFYPEKGGTSVINIKDLAVGTALALEKGKSGERYIITGENIGIKEFTLLIAGAIGSKARTAIMPLSVITIYGYIAEILGKMGIDIDFSLDIRRMTGNYWWHTCKKAEKELGYKAMYTAQATINETAEWYRNTYSQGDRRI